ncbi:MAG: hypothetical protein AAFP28_02645 [Pseudomonadota bacterium]
MLDKTGEALLSRRFEDFSDSFTIPTIVETFEGRRSLDSLDELRDAFNGVCTHYQLLRATDLVRHIVAAQFDGEDTIRSTHECRVLSGTQLAQAPFAVYSKIIRQDTTWRIAESIYVLEGAPKYTRALSHGSARVANGVSSR